MTDTLPAWRQALTDEAAGLRYHDPLGPALPGLTSRGLGFVRDDLLSSAANHEQQAREAFTAGNFHLVQRAEGLAFAYRQAARQITAYALMPGWAVTE